MLSRAESLIHNLFRKLYLKIIAARITAADIPNPTIPHAIYIYI